MKQAGFASVQMTLVLAATVGGIEAQGQGEAAFRAVRRLPNQEFAFEFTAPAGGVWRVDASNDLTNWEGWFSLRSTGTRSAFDPAAALRDQRFFRAVELAAATPLTGDHFATATGDVVVHPINHASLVLGWNGRTIYVDPVGGASPYQGLPRADLILVTHSHGDHFHAGTLDSVRGPQAVILTPQAVYNSLTSSLKAAAGVLRNGAQTNLLALTAEAVPAYNLTGSFHPKGTGNGYVLALGGKRFYFSGDTEDIPEMRALQNVDVAFVAMNTPYTMTVQKAISAVREFRPKVVYPYHYRNQDGSLTDLEAFRKGVGTDLGIEVRRRDWY